MRFRLSVTGKEGRNRAAVAVSLIGAAALCAAAVWFTLLGSGRDKSAGRYVYMEAEASNGMRLHALAVDPSRITLETVNANVTKTPYYGVNGGFFYGKDLLSIAMVDGKPVNGQLGAYGSGSSNVKYARGTLVWDGGAGRLDVQVVKDQAELELTDRTRFWAQGGISMSIGRDDDTWRAQAELEGAPFPDDERLRSAAVYDDAGQLYLIVSGTKGTLAAFREAIIEKIGNGRLAGGIFLDGDGSSQLRSGERALAGDGRPVVQMMRLTGDAEE